MTRDELLRDLGALGVRSGDLVMVHASLRKLGLARSQGVANGAELLFDALEAAVGADGTLLMVLGTEYEYDWVNQHPHAERARLLAAAPAFDFRAAPALEEVGHAAEAFRLRPGTLLSDNPSGRFAARGPRAAELLREQPWNDYYGPGSPLERLYDWGGRVLRLGANPDTVTVLHYAEYLTAVPNKRRTRWDYVLADEAGAPRHVWIECLDDAEGIAAWDGDDYFAEILRAYLALGRHAAGHVGQADSELIDAADLVRFGASWMAAHLGLATNAR
jgi:aminoglycoside N3'-acetyltransferase